MNQKNAWEKFEDLLAKAQKQVCSLILLLSKRNKILRNNLHLFGPQSK
jgi:hypothetical protein